jgi:hypothetical protein
VNVNRRKKYIYIMLRTWVINKIHHKKKKRYNTRNNYK